MDINEVRRLRERYEAVLDDADLARAAYHRAVRALHASGVPLRVIAEELGMSHQRVHQIVGDTTPSAKKRRRRVARAVGAATVIAVVLGAVILSRLPSSEPPIRRLSPVAVDVLAEGRSWRFEYLDHGLSVAGHSPEIVLPTSTPVAFSLRSADVVHSIWVPQLWGKQDIVPGRTNSFVLDTATLGTYAGRDAEFAGLAYTLPEFQVRIVPFAEFQRWIADARTEAP